MTDGITQTLTTENAENTETDFFCILWVLGG